MSNSYIDGLISPSKEKKPLRRARPKAGLEVSEMQTTKQHLEQQRILRAEQLRKRKIRAKNMSLAQSDDPLVGQAEIRRRRNSEIERKPRTADWDFFDGELRDNVTDSQEDLDKAPKQDEYRTESSRRAGVTNGITSRGRRKIGDFEKKRLNDFLQPVQAFGLVRKNTSNINESTEDATEETPIDLSSDDLFNNKKKKKEKKKEDNKPKKKGFFRRHLKLTIFLILLLSGGIGIFLYGNQLIAKITGGKSGLVDLVKTVVTEKITPLKADKQGRTNIAIFGTSGYDMAGHEGRSVHDGAQLTDSLMVMSVDQKEKNAITMSLPRDLKVGKEACYAGKINEVYTCASKDGKNEEAGANAVMNELSKITGLEMHYFVHVNWGSLIQIVDALGGITVTVDEDINDYYFTGIRMKAGVPTVLNGEKALALARARHGSVGGDFTRGENQQKVLVAIKNKIMEKGMDIPAMINLVNVLGDNLRTNVKIDEIKTAAKIFSDFNSANITSAPLTGLQTGDLVRNASYPVGGVDVSFVIPSAGLQNYTKIQQYLNSKIAEHSDSPATSRILVLNGTNESGVAANEKVELEKAGFKVTGTGNAPKGEYTEKVLIYSIGTKNETKKKLETYYGTSAKPANELPNGIDKTNYDFVVIIGKTDIKGQ